MAETIDAAYRKVEEQIPTDAKVVEKKEIKAPRQRSLAVTAEDESEARTRVKQQINKTDIIRNLRLTEVGKKGFLGIGR